MKQRFAVLINGEKPKIYRVPLNKSARIINGFPFQHVKFFENLNDAKAAACDIAESSEILPTSQIEKLRNTFSQLTEDRVETYFF